MVRLLYTVSALALVSAGVLLVLCIVEARQDVTEDPRMPGDSAVRMFERSSAVREQPRKTGPLIEQARILARYLNPPPSPDVKVAPVQRVVEGSASPFKQAVIPVAPSSRFKLHGTSCYPAQPERSMALISVPGAVGEAAMWVKEGDQVGHVVIHEIRRGAIICRAGDQLQEMGIETAWARRDLIQGPVSEEPTPSLATRNISTVEGGAMSSQQSAP
jgi:hypothetical protein